VSADPDITIPLVRKLAADAELKLSKDQVAVLIKRADQARHNAEETSDRTQVVGGDDDDFHVLRDRPW
jgi:hypothetical protein